MEYKDTLNLPKTDFPMKANLPNREPDILKSWARHSVFQKALDQSKKSKKYVLHDGPPSVSYTHLTLPTTPYV